MEYNSRIKLREFLIEKIEEYQKNGGKGHIKLDIDKEVFQRILFENNKITIPLRSLDLSNISFDGVNVEGADFTGSKGAKLNPQKVAFKSLNGTKLTDVEIKGSLKGVDVRGADFTGSKGAKLNPQKVAFKSLYCTKLADVEIKGSLDNVEVIRTDFTGSKGAIIDPQEVANKSLYCTKLTDVEIKGSFDGITVQGANFTGSKGGKLDPLTVKDRSLAYTTLTDVEIINDNREIEDKIEKSFKKQLIMINTNK